MKMGMAKVCGFLAMGILPFILLIESTVACKLPTVAEEKMRYCKYGILIKGIYLDKWDEAIQINNFRITEIYKGLCKMKNVVKIKTGSPGSCSYWPEDVNVRKFVIIANRIHGEIVCDYRTEWDSLSDTAKRALKEISRSGCN